MELINFNLKEYSTFLASDAPAPGGGAACAFAGAQGIALTLMVINLTIGKEKYLEFEDLCMKTKEQAEILMMNFLEGMDLDKEAFVRLSEAYKLPKGTFLEKETRSKAIGETTLEATRIPLETMKQGVLGLKLTIPLVGNSNKGAVSDLGVAAVNLLSCVKGAFLNVLINIPGIKDKELGASFLLKAEDLVVEAESLSKKIYEKVEKNIRG